MSLSVFVVKEKSPEKRVAQTPKSIQQLVQSGLNVTIEKGCGEESHFQDIEYKEAGAKVGTVKDKEKADIILAVNGPEKGSFKDGAYWVSFCDAEKPPVDVISLSKVPRTSRAQSMDALSSQSNLAGYMSVLLASTHLGKVFPLMMTAAGTVQPAKVVVIGAGVAGLQAIATAKRLGAQVFASDVRPAVKEQVESLGATFIDAGDSGAEDKGGYAKEATKEFLEKQKIELEKRIAKSDVVITTALIPGRKAPVLVSKEMVHSMPKGSVIVDLAAIQGGNCELTKKGEILHKDGYTIIGVENILNYMPRNASELYANNLVKLLGILIKDGKITLEDEIIEAALIKNE